MADACTTAENLEVYENLTYTNDIGDTFTVYDAAFEIGSDCIFGSGPAQASLADPQLDGCAVEATRLLTCLPSSCADCTAPGSSRDLRPSVHRDRRVWRRLHLLRRDLH